MLKHLKKDLYERVRNKKTKAKDIYLDTILYNDPG
jgi:hypothetical protein